jgi:hypothetical protein
LRLNHHKITTTLTLALVLGALVPDAASARLDLNPAPTRTTASQPAAQVVRVSAPEAFDWGDAGIGAAGALGLSTLAIGSGLVIAASRTDDRAGRTDHPPRRRPTPPQDDTERLAVPIPRTTQRHIDELLVMPVAVRRPNPTRFQTNRRQLNDPRPVAVQLVPAICPAGEADPGRAHFRRLRHGRQFAAGARPAVLAVSGSADYPEQRPRPSGGEATTRRSDPRSSLAPACTK